MLRNYWAVIPGNPPPSGSRYVTLRKNSLCQKIVEYQKSAVLLYFVSFFRVDFFYTLLTDFVSLAVVQYCNDDPEMSVGHFFGTYRTDQFLNPTRPISPI